MNKPGEVEAHWRPKLREMILQNHPDKRSEFSQRVREFMRAGDQQVLPYPGDPGERVRLLAAKLLMEETLETVKALGVQVVPCKENIFSLQVGGEFDLVETADGACDTIFVAYWAMNACGIADYLPMLEVCDSNDRKFGPGSYKDENGKVRKPAGWVGPEIKKAIAAQIAAGERKRDGIKD